MAYSRPAIEFSQSVFVGSRFTVSESVARNNRMGRTLRLTHLMKQTTNPDDWLWTAQDEDNNYYEVRNHWLRRCCEKTD